MKLTQHSSLLASLLLFTPNFITALPQPADSIASSNTTSREKAIDLNGNNNTIQAKTSTTPATNTTMKVNTSTLAGVIMQLADDITGRWKTLTCADPAVTDATIDPQKRWDALDVNDAWNAAVAAAKTSTNAAGVKWPALISNFFHGPDNMGCGSLAASNGCVQDVLCEDPPKSYVPMFEILNSFVGISSLNYNLYDSLTKAESAVTTQVGSFSSTFAPIDPKTDGWKVILDIIGLGFALTVSPLWNSAFKAIPFFARNPNTLGTLKDSVNPLVSNGITIIKDGSVVGQSVNAQNTLESNMGNLVAAWSATLSQINENLFNGSDASVKQLGDLIDGGKTLGGTTVVDDVQASNAAQLAIYAYMIPQAWALSNKDVRPFIADTGLPCSGPDTVNSKYIPDGAASISSSCVNGKYYHVLACTGDAVSPGYYNPNGGPSMPIDNTFSIPPGLDKLDGKAWGGLTKDNIAAAAVASYAANGNKNGAAPIDVGTSDGVNSIIDHGVEAPGIIILPVCGYEEAYNNWYHHNTPANFPCN